MYKIKNTEIEELKNTIENKDLAPTVEYLNYKLNGEPLCFYERTAEWQALYSTLNTFFDYYQDETNKIDESKITYRNGICSFKDIILNYTKSQLKDRLPEDAAPYTSFTHILIKKYSSDSVRIYENTTNKVLKDTIQADRLVILLQAAGGGGGGTSNVYAATWCIGGEDGGAGGSGGFLALVLNTKYLRDNGGTFRIALGPNGCGKYGTGWAADTGVILGNGTVHGFDGTNAADCEVYYDNGTSSIQLFTIGGGKGGKSAREYTAGAPGAGGQVTEHDNSYKDRLYWLLPIYQNNTLFETGMIDGKAGGKDNEKGQSTPNLKIKTAPSITTNKFNSNFTYSIGGYSGGSSQGGNSSGGAASYFGCGGNGGPLASNGEDGKTGAGGGGGRWSYGGRAIGIWFSPLAGASIKNGGHGGPAKVMIFY